MYRIYALLAMFCFGLAPLLYKAGAQSLTNPHLAVLWHNLGAVLVVGTYFFTTRQLSIALKMRPSVIIAIVAGAILTSCLAQAFYYHALKTGPVAHVATMIAAYPIVTIVATFLIKGSMPELLHLIGVVLVVVGVILVQL